ncbi:MAG: tetratricopeptide repeat protein, partial [Nitrospirota bacterium]
RIRKNNPAASFFILWFFIAHAPESSVFPIKDTVVEYRLYLSSIGLLAAVFAIIREKAAFPALQRAAAVCIIVVFGLLTVNRNTVWADDYSLWRDVVKQSPASVRAHTNLGRALLNGRRYQAAMSQFQTAEGLSPLPGDSYQLHNLRGQCLVGMGNARGAVSEFNAAINSAPRLAEAYANLGMAYYSAGRYAEAVKPLKEAVMLDPGHDTAHVNLALAYTMLGRHHDALLEMQAARMYMPKDFKVNYRLAAIYLNNGMKPEAREQAKNALRLADNDGQRASVLALLKRIGD